MELCGDDERVKISAILHVIRVVASQFYLDAARGRCRLAGHGIAMVGRKVAPRHTGFIEDLKNERFVCFLDLIYELILSFTSS